MIDKLLDELVAAGVVADLSDSWQPAEHHEARGSVVPWSVHHFVKFGDDEDGPTSISLPILHDLLRARGAIE